MNKFGEILTGGATRPGNPRSKLRGFLPVLLAAASAHAADVYRCTDGQGRPVFTSSPSQYSACRLLDVKVSEPSESDLEKARDRQRRADERQREEEEKNIRERELRAKEAAAEAAMRQARAAEQAAKARESVQYQPAVPLGVYPYWGYDRRHLPHPYPHHDKDRKDFRRDRPPPGIQVEIGAGSGPRRR